MRGNTRKYWTDSSSFEFGLQRLIKGESVDSEQNVQQYIVRKKSERADLERSVQ